MEITKKGVAFMKEQVEAGRPFYLQLSHWAVHANLEATAASLAKYEAKPRGAQQVNPAFAAMTEDLDAGMGAILEALDSLDIEDDTYVVYMSDNGSVPNIPGARKYERSYNHPLSRGKWDALEGCAGAPHLAWPRHRTRVPFGCARVGCRSDADPVGPRRGRGDAIVGPSGRGSLRRS